MINTRLAASSLLVATIIGTAAGCSVERPARGDGEAASAETETETETVGRVSEALQTKQTLLYTNDFADAVASQKYPVDPTHRVPYATVEGPTNGPAAHSVQLVVPFWYSYTPVADATKGLRFPTVQQQPGGSDYAMFPAYAMLYGDALSKPHMLFKSKVVLPKTYNHDVPSYYYEHRYLFSIDSTTTSPAPANPLDSSAWYGTPRTNMLGVRWTSNTAVGIFVDSAQVGTIDLGTKLAGGVEYDFAADVELKAAGKIKITFANKTHTQAISWSAANFAKPYLANLSPGGNSYAGKDYAADAQDYFSALKKVEVYEVTEVASAPTVSPALVRVKLPGIVGSAAVTSDGSWTATSDSTWLHVTTASGTGNGTLAYTVDDALSYGPTRYGRITIRDAGGVAVVTVAQSRQHERGWDFWCPESAPWHVLWYYDDAYPTGWYPGRCFTQYQNPTTCSAANNCVEIDCRNPVNNWYCSRY